MSIYSGIYLFLAIIILIIVAANRLDMLCVCAVCFVVYSIYCIPGIGISGFYRPKLSPELYFNIYIQMVIIIIFLLLVRRKEKKPFIQSYELNDNKAENKMITRAYGIYTLVIFGFMLSNVIHAGWDVFVSGKANVWTETNVFYVISLYGAYPSFAYGLRYKKKWMCLLSLIIEFTIFFAGSRAFLTTMFIIFLCELGYRLQIKNKKSTILYIFGATAVVFLLIYRSVDVYIMKGDFSGALQILGKAETWGKALEFNEPRVIIANYDYVLTTKTSLPLGDVLYRIIDFVPGLTKVFPIKLSFPEYFSEWLQEAVHGSTGVGGTFWGESYAMFGTVGIPALTVIWLVFINMCNKHLSMRDEWSSFVIPVGIHLGWYINRLDYNRVGQVIKVLLLCALIWIAIYLIIGGSITIGKITLRITRFNDTTNNRRNIKIRQ